MSNPEIKVDINKVLDYMSQQTANLTKELAIAQATNESLQEINEKQEKVIEAYKEKEKATNK